MKGSSAGGEPAGVGGGRRAPIDGQLPAVDALRALTAHRWHSDGTLTVHFSLSVTDHRNPAGLLAGLGRETRRIPGLTLPTRFGETD